MKEENLTMNWRLIPIIAFATALCAQGPMGGRPHRMLAQAKTDQAQSYLNLTDAQIQSLKQLRQSEMAALKPIFQQIAPLHESLRTQTESGSADAATVGKLVLNIQTLEQQISTTRSTFQQQAVGILTADQKTKLAALQSAADLMPTIHQAMGLGLLTPPKGAEGMGPGGFGLEMFHPGPRP
jgi:Spy/CpxP family protein refolding chaperone